MSVQDGRIVCPKDAEAHSHLLSINQIRKSTGLSRKFITKQIKLGKLPAIRLSPRAIRVDAGDFEAFLGRHRTDQKREVSA